MKKNMLTIIILSFCLKVYCINPPLGDRGYSPSGAGGITPLGEKGRDGGLKIGDHLPAITVTHLHNYTSAAASLSAFYKNKPLILVFWSTHCGTCLRSLPKLNALVQQEGGAFNVLSVTEENDADVQKLFNSLDTLKNIHLPYVTDDKVFDRYFPHRYIPHVIWINTKGVVSAVTSEDEVTAVNIKTFIEKDAVALLEKKDDLDFNIQLPYAPARDQIVYKSQLTAYNPMLQTDFIIEARRDSLSKIIDSVKRFSIINVKPLSLLYEAFAELTDLNTTGSPFYPRIVFNIHDSADYYFPYPDNIPNTTQWRSQHLYCYEKITPPETKQQFFTAMLDELNASLPIKGTIERRMVPCYLLTTENNTRLLSSPYDSSDLKFLRNTALQETTIVLQKIYLKSLLIELNEFSLNMPVYDDTGIDGPVNLRITLKVKDKEWYTKYDVESLQESLNKYGLKLIETEKPMDVLVIKDN